MRESVRLLSSLEISFFLPLSITQAGILNWFARFVRDLDLWRRFLVEHVLGETLAHNLSSFTATLVEGLGPE